jgi:hypothetical protein
LGRIFQFLDDSPVIPANLPASQVTPSWAAGWAARILDDHFARGAEARGLVRFLSTWLVLRADFDAGVAAARTWSLKLLDPNATLTTLLAGPTGDPHRKGIFTDQQVLAARTGITRRGQWFGTRLFCAPPVGQVPLLLPPLQTMPGMTRRQSLEAMVAPPSCIGCHNVTDPPGFSLEHFDDLGMYRDTDNGRPVDSSGTLLPPLPMLSFTSIDDLAPQLATSCVVAQCFTKTMMIDAFAAPSTSANLPFTGAELDQVATTFANSNFSIRELVKAIVATPSFLR